MKSVIFWVFISESIEFTVTQKFVLFIEILFNNLAAMSKQHVFRILAFGIARDITGGSTFDIELEEGGSVEDLRAAILRIYPEFG